MGYDDRGGDRGGGYRRDRDRYDDRGRDRDRDRDRERYDRGGRGGGGYGRRDDYRGGGGGGGGGYRRDRYDDRGGRGRGGRSPSWSPPPTGPRERRRPTLFDMRPEDMAPGAAGSEALLAGAKKAGADLPEDLAGAGQAVVLQASQQSTRHARRIYVGGLPPMANEQMVSAFFSQALVEIGGAATADAVVNVYINFEKRFSFVEFRTVEETSNALALDQVLFEGHHIRVRRPNDYNAQAAAAFGPTQPKPGLNLEKVGLTPGPPAGGPSALSPDRIFVGGLPYYLDEDQCIQLLSQFGAVKSFDLVRDQATQGSKGYGFCVYEDTKVTDFACQGLNGLKMGDKVLTVRRANPLPGPGGPRPPMMMMPPGGMMPMAPNAQHAAMQQALISANKMMEGATTVVKLAKCVTVEELADPEEYAAIVEDMEEEGGKHGEVRVVIPKPPAAGAPAPPGLGKVFLKFAAVAAAAKFRHATNGRKFGESVVEAAFMPEDAFEAGRLDD